MVAVASLSSVFAMLIQLTIVNGGDSIVIAVLYFTGDHNERKKSVAKKRKTMKRDDNGEIVRVNERPKPTKSMLGMSETISTL